MSWLERWWQAVEQWKRQPCGRRFVHHVIDERGDNWKITVELHQTAAEATRRRWLVLGKALRG